MDEEINRPRNFKIKLIAFIAYLVVMIGVENVYRTPLFDYSVRLEEKLFKSTDGSYIKIYFKITSYFGSQTLLIPIIVILCFFVNIQKMFCLFASLFFPLFIDNIMKIIYCNPRPFWIKPKMMHSCDMGFGNPSGHSFVSGCMYFSIWSVFTDFDYFKKTKFGVFMKYLLFYFFFLFVLSIMLSRIFLSVHSLNQVLYGFILGSATYFFFFNVFDIQKKQDSGFLKSIYIYKLRFFIFLGLAYFILFMLYGFRKVDKIEEYRQILKDNCGEKYEEKEYQALKNDGLLGGMCYMFLIGMYIGFLALYKRTPEDQVEKLIEWQNDTVKRRLIKFVFLILFAFPLIPYVLPIKGLVICLIFKIALPMLISGFSVIFGGILVGNYVANRCYPEELNISPRDIDLNPMPNNSPLQEMNNIPPVENNNGDNLMHVNPRVESSSGQNRSNEELRVNMGVPNYCEALNQNNPEIRIDAPIEQINHPNSVNS